MNDMPPLKAVVALESAMRLGSFSLAAAELNVTPGAIGQQVRKLEEWLGIGLFTRHIRQVQPTPAGLAYYARIQPALAQIAQASRTLRLSQKNDVWLSMPPSLAAKWFARRMADFLKSHSEVALHLSSSTALVDFEVDAIDLAIRYFDGNDPDLSAHLLYADEARVYSSPGYARRIGLDRPEDLVRATLLHNTLHPHWEAWLQHFSRLGQTSINAIPGIHFDQSLIAIDAAVREQGVVLTSALLTEDELASGTLIELFGLRLPLSMGYYLIHARTAILRAPVQTLKTWLIQTADAQPPVID